MFHDENAGFFRRLAWSPEGMLACGSYCPSTDLQHCMLLASWDLRTEAACDTPSYLLETQPERKGRRLQ